MDELINLVAAKTGLSRDMAKLATETVLQFVKSKLPPPLAAQIDGVISGGAAGGAGVIGAALGGAGGLGGALGDMFKK